jgi:uncharacterized protein (DUF697 family)
MAATLNPATDTPTAIDTAEKAAAWLCLLLNNLYGSVTYQELPGALLERVCDVNIVKAADGSTRMIARLSIPLDEAYVTATSQKLWTFAQGMTADSATVPAAYKVD